MIGRLLPPEAGAEHTPPKGYDDFDLRLGDVMRGERATLGKSLLDVQRELKIKASFIAAIENADISAFETPGFIAGYVRSYSRYLGLDPEWAFETFCREANFVSPSTKDKLGTPPSSKAPVYRKDPVVKSKGYDPFADPRFAFAPRSSSPFSNLEPRAIGSTLVLLALIAAVSYGGWSVLQQVQRVQVSPVEQVPLAIAAIDPLADVRGVADHGDIGMAESDSAQSNPLERLYRPQPLDAPVMVPRDGPIAALDPRMTGALAPSALPDFDGSRNESFAQTGTAASGSDEQGLNQADAIIAALAEAAAGPKVTVDAPEVVLMAVRPAWVRIRAGNGTVLLEKILNPGDTWVVPQTETPPILRTGAAGAIYFAVNGQTYGPAGAHGAVVDKIALNPVALTEKFAMADPASGEDARKAVAVAEAMLAPEPQPSTLKTE
ncbi:helix-turn-helix domain-containing protein [Tropicimonas sp. IMCC34043]|uniref:helix-turn-helix domain-containing protein n=1 Tax=Tropicimonas sp. IMCC34043 TaxID=2248760 RepID=UPI000E25743F|nr:helix-turn-helix domain-containing protein [Tropicimonas sp. IMCC34043]